MQPVSNPPLPPTPPTPPEPVYTPPADPELNPIEKMIASGGWPNIFFGD